MPIRIIRDDSQDRPPTEEVDPQSIVVATQGEAKEPADDAGEATKILADKGPPVQTTWAMVQCQCTLSGRSYQLVFRKEEGSFVLISVDRTVDSTARKDMSGIEGPFDWAAFECPECSGTWEKTDATAPAWPVILCSCQSLFCTTKGLSKRKGKSDDGWWWRCPKCGIDALASVGIDSLDGKALKGK